MPAGGKTRPGSCGCRGIAGAIPQQRLAWVPHTGSDRSPPALQGSSPPKLVPPTMHPWPGHPQGRPCSWVGAAAGAPGGAHAQAAPAPAGCGVHWSEWGLPGSALAPPGPLPGSHKAGVCCPAQTPPRPPPPPDKAVPRRQDGAGGTALSSQQGLGQPWLSSSPERPVPGTGQWRKPHCNRRAGSRGEGAFLGCLGAESPPATAATHTPRRHGHTRKACAAPKHAGAHAMCVHTRSNRHVLIHAARPCTRGHTVTHTGTHGDTRTGTQTHTARRWPHVC